MLPGRLKILHASGNPGEKPDSFCSAFISNDDASVQEQRRGYFAEQKLDMTEGARVNRISGVISPEEGNLHSK